MRVMEAAPLLFFGKESATDGVKSRTCSPRANLRLCLSSIIFLLLTRRKERGENFLPVGGWNGAPARPAYRLRRRIIRPFTAHATKISLHTVCPRPHRLGALIQ